MRNVFFAFVSLLLIVDSVSAQNAGPAPQIPPDAGRTSFQFFVSTSNLIDGGGTELIPRSYSPYARDPRDGFVVTLHFSGNPGALNYFLPEGEAIRFPEGQYASVVIERVFWVEDGYVIDGSALTSKWIELNPFAIENVESLDLQKWDWNKVKRGLRVELRPDFENSGYVVVANGVYDKTKSGIEVAFSHCFGGEDPGCETENQRIFGQLWNFVSPHQFDTVHDLSDIEIRVFLYDAENNRIILSESERQGYYIGKTKD